MISQIELRSLGSGSLIPAQRAPYSVYFQVGGYEFIIGAPEGVQQKLFNLGVGLSIDSIFITESTKKSMLGLPGLLKTLDYHANRQRELNIYYIDKVADELESIVEFSDYDGFTVNTHMLQPGQVAVSRDDYDVKLIDNGNSTSAAILLSENSVRGEFNREIAEELGVPPGPKYSRLCNGESVESTDGSIVKPEQVLEDAPNKINILCSGRAPKSKIERVEREIDVFICEAATLSQFSELESRSSVSDAINLGSSLAPDTLLLTRVSHGVGHFSDRQLVQRASNFETASFDVDVFSAGDQTRITHNDIVSSAESPTEHKFPHDVSEYDFSNHCTEVLSDSTRAINRQVAINTIRNGTIQQADGNADKEFVRDWKGVKSYILVGYNDVEDVPVVITGWCGVHDPQQAVESNSWTEDQLREIHEFNGGESLEADFRYDY